ncbi:MAG: LPXTG cell wall anchor domain-containing protein [Clostridia bacterium]|nr:LPXTG cell wall anchor domain-containing protein [Clostridia bacterium]MBR6788066.1 LPXTG cell wall anchor domain-containing protein [Clostridia bacterium]
MGIIGGADGPTAVFVTGSLSGVMIAGGMVLFAAALMVYLWRRRKGKK